MFQNGSLVTLVDSKVHGEGNDAIRLQSGVCGMVTNGQRKKDGNHLYTVDFGAYGAWYCTQRELSGDDKEGWDGDQVEEQEQDSNLPTGWVVLEDRIGHENRNDLNEEFEEDRDDDTGEPAQTTEVNWDRFFNEHPEEDPSDYVAPKIDLEKDIQKRMKEIEKGHCYDSSE